MGRARVHHVPPDGLDLQVTLQATGLARSLGGLAQCGGNVRMPIAGQKSLSYFLLLPGYTAQLFRRCSG